MFYLQQDPIFTVLFLLMIASLIFFMYFYLFAPPKTQASWFKMVGASGQMKRQFMTQLILALEDPEVRAMLYDAMQEESQRRKKQS